MNNKFKFLNTLNWGKPKGLHERSQLLTNQSGSSVEVDAEIIQPMFLEFQFLPTIGDTDPDIVGNLPNAINQASMNYYNYIRSKNSSISSFAVNDIIKYIYAISNLYSVWRHVYKLLAYSMLSNPLNMGYRLMRYNAETAGFTSNELASKLARLEVLRGRIQAFTLPTDIPYVNRHMYLAGETFRDEPDNEYSAFISFAPFMLRWKLLPGDTNIGSVTVEEGTGYLEFLENAVSVYEVDEDVQSISSELLKAQDYSKGVYALPEVSLDAMRKSFNPIFDLNVIDEIRNASIHNAASDLTISEPYGIYESSTTGGLINGKTGRILVGTVYTENEEIDGTYINESEKYVYTHELNPDGVTVSDITHFTNYCTPFSNNHCAVQGVGSEILFYCTAYYINVNSEPTELVFTSYCDLNLMVVDSNRMKFRNGLSRLDFLPDVHVFDITQGQISGTHPVLQGTVDNYTTVSRSQLRQIHNITFSDEWVSDFTKNK